MTTRTIADLLREAILVQDACNLSPVCVLFSSKIADLTESEGQEAFSRAYQTAQRETAS